MAIRINKVLGYGITGMSRDPLKNFVTDDPDININALTSQEHIEAHDDPIDWLRFYGKQRTQYSDVSHQGIMMDINRSIMMDGMLEDGVLPNSGFYDHIVYEGELGDPGTLIIVPPGNLNTWVRHNDSIDYYESQLHDPNNMSVNVYELSEGIDPWISYMRTDTGEKLSYFDLQYFHLFHGELTNKETTSVNEALKNLADKFNWSGNPREFLKVIVPEVPDEVRLLAEWTRLFTNENAWKRLRPMIYTYWT